MLLRTYYLILFIILLSSGISVGLLWFYMNPFSDIQMATSLMGIALFLTGGSLGSFLLFFLKKIYYRGDVTLSTMNASIRQAMLLMIGLLGTAALFIWKINDTHLIIAIWATVGCIEVMIQAVE